MLLARRRAAGEAVKYLAGARVVGVGTGSTVEALIELLGEAGVGDSLFVASSLDTLMKLASRGFRVVDPSSISRLDVYVDSADEVDKNLDMIKGGGAALTLEKTLSFYSEKRVFVVDYTKVVDRLGSRGVLPIEVLPEAVSMVLAKIVEVVGRAEVRSLRGGKFGPVVSDTRGVVIDVGIPEGLDVRELDKRVRSLPGVVETGLFTGLADVVIVGYPDRVKVLSRL